MADKKPPPNPTAYGYGRASHVDNSDASIPAQHERIMDCYERDVKPLGVKWGKFLLDAQTSAYRGKGKRLERRAGGKELLSLIQPGDWVIFDRLDRVFRSVQDAVSVIEELNKRQIHVRFVAYGHLDTNNATGRMFLQMLAVMAEFDSALKSERIKEGQQRARVAGVAYVGTMKRHGIGIRWRRVSHPIKRDKVTQIPIWCPIARAIMDRIVALRDEEGLDWVTIARTINHDIKYGPTGGRGYKSTGDHRYRGGFRIISARLPRPFRVPHAKQWYIREKEYRIYGITDPRDFNRTDHPRLTLIQAEAIRAPLVIGPDDILVEPHDTQTNKENDRCQDNSPLTSSNLSQSAV